MKRDNRIHLPSLALGALLVLVGVAIGAFSDPKLALAEDGGLQNPSPFMGGEAAIYSFSQDGKTLYLWKVGGGGGATISALNGPRFIGEVKAP